MEYGGISRGLREHIGAYHGIPPILVHLATFPPVMAALKRAELVANELFGSYSAQFAAPVRHQEPWLASYPVVTVGIVETETVLSDCWAALGNHSPIC